MTNLWNKLKNKFKCTYTNILIIIILLAFGVLLYNTISGFKNVNEGFTVTDIVNNKNIFGNYITSYSNNSGSYPNSSIINIPLNTVYRVEAVVMNLKSDSNYQFQITYSNNGTQFQCYSLQLPSGQSQYIIKDTNLLNTQGSKIYTDTLTLTFSGLPTTITPSSFITSIDVYGMNLGDYDANYYQDTSVNTEFNLTNLSTKTATTDVYSETDPQNSSQLIHYLTINSSANDPTDKYVKGLNYYIKYPVPTTTRPTATNPTTTNPTTTGTSLQILSIAYINSKSKTQYIVTDKSGNSNSPSTYTLYPIDTTPGKYSGTIYFSVPILANMLIITTGLGITFTTGGASTNAISRSSITTSVFGKNPDDVEMNTTAIPNYVMQQINNGQCPSIDTIVSNQNLTQQLCDDLENQDRIRMEKIKLEKEKQYLIKLKKQDDEITRLQGEISAIESNRKNRDAVLDNLKLAQYQKQREEAVQLRDTASEKLAQQAKRNLNLAVNLVQ